VRPALARLSAAGAVAAALAGLVLTWNRLGDERDDLTRAEADRAAAVREELPDELFASWRARVGPDDRYWLDVPEGGPVGMTTRGAVFRAYAVYRLLPALPASSREQATVVLALDRLP
jgi:hypothetical protein